jgi:hypothetical protein
MKNGDESAVYHHNRKCNPEENIYCGATFASTRIFTLCKVNPGDSLLTVLVSEENSSNIMLVSRKGMAIRFDQTDLRPMGLIATGVNGMKLKEDDRLAAALLVTERIIAVLYPAAGGLGKMRSMNFRNKDATDRESLRYGWRMMIPSLERLNWNPEKHCFCSIMEREKTRPIRLTTVKQIKRARQLKSTIKMVNQNVMGLSLVLLEKARRKEQNLTREPETATKVKKHKDNDLEDAVVPPAPSNTDREDANSIGGQSSDPEQYSLF